MASRAGPGRPWSDTLGLQLLSAFSDGELTGHWGLRPAGPGDTGGRRQTRNELLTCARDDDELRGWIIEAWRHANPDVVAAVDHALTVGLTPDSARALDEFAAEDVLLALVTDEFGDGPAQARAFVNVAVREKERRPLLAALQQLLGEAGPACRRVRVIVIGGHPRDESRPDVRLYAQSPFDVRWKTFERKQGPSAIVKAVACALRRADAAVIVVGMASHALMHVAREQAERLGIPWKCIAKATDRQLMDALHGLFPGIARDGA
jgi:hypothetical protein